MESTSNHGKAVILIGETGNLPIIFEGGSSQDLLYMVEEHSDDFYCPGDGEKELNLSSTPHLNYISGVAFFNGAINCVYDVTGQVAKCDENGYELIVEGEDHKIDPDFARGIPVKLSDVEKHSQKCTDFLDTCLNEYVEEGDVPPLFIVQVSHFKISKAEEATIDIISNANPIEIWDRNLDEDDDGSIFCGNAKWIEVARTCSVVAFAYHSLTVGHGKV
jgi:hypothetical protein